MAINLVTEVVKREFVRDLASNFTFDQHISVFPILIHRIDLGFIKIPPPSLWPLNGVLCSALALSPEELDNCSNRTSVSILFSSTLNQKLILYHYSLMPKSPLHDQRGERTVLVRQQLPGNFGSHFF